MPQKLRTATTRTAWVILACGSFLVACANHGSTGAAGLPVSPSTQPSAVPVATPSAGTSQLRLPIESYLLTPAQIAQADHAVALKTQECMKRYGFDLTIPPELTHQKEDGQIQRRYGPSNLSDVQRYGYHNAPNPDDQAQTKVPLPAELPGPERLVLVGGTNGTTPNEATAPNGQRVPAGGCRGEATREIAGTGFYGSSALAQQISDESYSHSRSDQRVTAAMAAWSACMKTAGFQYQTPVDAYNDPKWRGAPTASPQEIAAAVADVTCKQQTNLIGIWYSVESAFQQQQIAQHVGQLDGDKSHEQQELAAVAQAPQASSTPTRQG